MMGITNPIFAIVRGAFVSHAMYQFIMGAHYYEYKKAQQQGKTGRAKFEKFLMFFVPIFIHGLNDYITTLETDADTEEGQLMSLLVILALILLNLVTLIIGLFKANRAKKEETIIGTQNVDEATAEDAIETV